MRRSSPLKRLPRCRTVEAGWRNRGARAKEEVEIARSNILLIEPTCGGKTLLALSDLASWCYRYRRYAGPWELLSARLVRLADPRVVAI
jgi:hypothetical protein